MPALIDCPCGRRFQPTHIENGWAVCPQCGVHLPGDAAGPEDDIPFVVPAEPAQPVVLTQYKPRPATVSQVAHRTVLWPIFVGAMFCFFAGGKIWSQTGNHDTLMFAFGAVAHLAGLMQLVLGVVLLIVRLGTRPPKPDADA